MVASAPFCTGYALHACFHAKARIAARVGLALAAAELLFIVVLLVLMNLDPLYGSGG
jgi:hypothetical protein